jgi:hypothetical protein
MFFVKQLTYAHMSQLGRPPKDSADVASHFVGVRMTKEALHKLDELVKVDIWRAAGTFEKPDAYGRPIHPRTRSSVIVDLIKERYEELASRTGRKGRL